MFYCLAVDGKHNSVVLLLPTQCVIDFKNGERLVYSDVVDWIDSLLIFYLIVVLLQRHILEKDSCSRPTQIHWRFVASKSLVLHCHRYRDSRVYSSCRRNHGPGSFRPFGARSSHWYIPQRASRPRA